MTGEFITEIGVIAALHSPHSKLNIDLIQATLKKVLQIPDAEAIYFAEACLNCFPSVEQWELELTAAAAIMGYKRKLGNFAIALSKLCLKHNSENTAANVYIPHFLLETQQYIEAIDAAQKFYQNSKTLEDRFLSSCVLLKTLMRAGDWQKVHLSAEQFEIVILETLKDQCIQLSLNTIQFFFVNVGLFAYLQDNPAKNRKLQNQAGHVFLNRIHSIKPKTIQPAAISSKKLNKRLKIGYISSTFRKHSVGWLSRWLFKYHDHKRIEVCAYTIEQNSNDEFFQAWFLDQFDQVKALSGDAGLAAEEIRDDCLDILVDLDSLTSEFTCTVLALKPAPIQVTWLAYDATGLSTVDYFIADPFVLPDNAQDYYQEKIWRLPQTYIAVDGFEVGVPTIRRFDLDIPEDSVIYWSSQVGFKRHLDTVRLQMKILKEVPNSYYLIKGLGDQNIISSLFINIAEDEGITRDRLKFLPMVADEYTHRANLQIADVVLDTYPYNGATTSLEALWAGIPLVTRVGQQFAARNSYAFLKNLDITEGIALNDAEYIEWGIRLGQDKNLRNQVAWKLQKSRNTSPLWNARQFAYEMEKAYRSMHEISLQQKA